MTSTHSVKRPVGRPRKVVPIVVSSHEPVVIAHSPLPKSDGDDTKAHTVKRGYVRKHAYPIVGADVNAVIDDVVAMLLKLKK